MSHKSRFNLSEETHGEISKARQLVQGKKQYGNSKTSFTNSQAEYIKKRIDEAIEDAENTGVPVVHVKDGKPLTEHGARLLGVPWTRRPA